jgi:hypothetical protein
MLKTNVKNNCVEKTRNKTGWQGAKKRVLDEEDEIDRERGVGRGGEHEELLLGVHLEVLADEAWEEAQLLLLRTCQLHPLFHMRVFEFCWGSRSRNCSTNV